MVYNMMKRGNTMDFYTEINGELFSQLLKAYRKMHGVSQQEVSDAIGVKRTTYAKYELGRKPSLEVIASLCNYYGITPGEMLDLCVPKKEDSALRSPVKGESSQSICLLDAQEKKLLDLFRGSADKAAIIEFAGKLFTQEQIEKLKED